MPEARNTEHRRTLAATGLALLGVLAAGTTHAADPPLKPGRDPAGTAVAVLAQGFDYTQPEIASALARDGEGEAIAWDAVDGDHRPFAKESPGTGIARAVTARGGVRLVLVRVADGDRASLARAIAFAASTPARIVLVPLSDKTRGEIEVLEAAARKFTALLFVASLPRLNDDERKKGDAAPNLVLLDADNEPEIAAASLARALGCGAGDLGGETGADRKRVLLERRARAAPRPDEAKTAGCEAERGSRQNGGP
jgi:subtilisin family serine protease